MLQYIKNLKAYVILQLNTVKFTVFGGEFYNTVKM